MAGNSNLAAAKKCKNDEFYTRLTDIEKELRHYKKHFAEVIRTVMKSLQRKVTSQHGS